MQARGKPFLADPILDPIPFGFTASLVRYHALRQRHPDVRIMMGVGNLTELTEADMVHAFVTEDEFRRMIADGEIFDAPTIAAYGLLRMVG